MRNQPTPMKRSNRVALMRRLLRNIDRKARQVASTRQFEINSQEFKDYTKELLRKHNFVIALIQSGYANRPMIYGFHPTKGSQHGYKAAGA